MHVVKDGEEAMKFLRKEDEFSQAPRPELILLDLNLPTVDGFQVLKRMKSDNATKNMPVIILTTSDNDRDISRCYELGCSVYLTKPIVCGDFASAIQKLGLFLSVASIPKRG